MILQMAEQMKFGDAKIKKKKLYSCKKAIHVNNVDI